MDVGKSSCFFLLLTHYKPTHLELNAYEKRWATNSGALGMPQSYLYFVSFMVPFIWKTGEGTVLDETLFLMKWPSVQSLGWCSGTSERSPVQLA